MNNLEIGPVSKRISPFYLGMYSIVIASALLLIWWLWQGSLPLPVGRFEAIFSQNGPGLVSPGRDFFFDTILQNNLIVWSAIAGLSVLILAVALLIFFGLRDYFAGKNNNKKRKRPSEVTYLNQMSEADEAASLQLMVQETEIRDDNNQIDFTPREFTQIGVLKSDDDYSLQKPIVEELFTSLLLTTNLDEDSVFENLIDSERLPQIAIDELVATGRLVANRLRQDNNGDRGIK